jgi:hypothetical protein
MLLMRLLNDSHNMAGLFVDMSVSPSIRFISVRIWRDLVWTVGQYDVLYNA